MTKTPIHRWPKLAIALVSTMHLACTKKEPPPPPSPSPPPTQPVGACQNIDTEGVCGHLLDRLAEDAGAEVGYEVRATCSYDGGAAVADERARLLVPRAKAKDLEAHYAAHLSDPCRCVIVRPPCAPSVGVSVRVDPPPYARVVR